MQNMLFSQDAVIWVVSFNISFSNMTFVFYLCNCYPVDLPSNCSQPCSHTSVTNNKLQSSPLLSSDLTEGPFNCVCRHEPYFFKSQRWYVEYLTSFMSWKWSEAKLQAISCPFGRLETREHSLNFPLKFISPSLGRASLCLPLFCLTEVPPAASL